MADILLIVLNLILFGIRYCIAFDCNSDKRTMIKATDIQNDYFISLDCQHNHGYSTWQYYMSKCLESATCVGIRSSVPPLLCSLSNTHVTEPLPMDNDLWLIVSELERYRYGIYFKLLYFDKTHN